MSVSTSNIGLRRDGSFEQYAPPRVIELGGGGGGAGPLLSSAVATPPFTTPFASMVTLALPSGRFDVWVSFAMWLSGPATGIHIGVSLDGLTFFGTTTGFDIPAGTVIPGLATPPVEITLAAPQTIHGASLIWTGATNITNTGVQLFARQLA